MRLQWARLSSGLLLAGLTSCASVPAPPNLGLQRSLYPGLGSLKAEQIPAAFDVPLELEPPLSGGIAWLSETGTGSAAWAPGLTEYQRTGVLNAAADSLRRPPFTEVSVLPTVIESYGTTGGPVAVDTVRSAAAQFQYDVGFLLQTGIAEDRGINPFAIGYVGLVTAPLFPGTDAAIAASAELCAVDVRSGVMLGCSRGRALREARFLFPLSVSSRVDAAREQAVHDAVVEASSGILPQIASRVSR